MVNHTTKLPVIFHHALMWFQHVIPLPTSPAPVSYPIIFWPCLTCELLFKIGCCTLSMPKPRKSRSHRSQAATNLFGPASPAGPASGAGPSPTWQISANNLQSICTAMPAETLRFTSMLYTKPVRVAPWSLASKEASLRLRILRRKFPLIASIVEVKLANLNSRSTKWPGRPAWNRTGSSQELQALVGGHPPFQQQTATITNGEYVDLASLLPFFLLRTRFSNF